MPLILGLINFNFLMTLLFKTEVLVSDAFIIGEEENYLFIFYYLYLFKMIPKTYRSLTTGQQWEASSGSKH